MTSQAFTLPWSNPDLDVHPAPMPGWHRVAAVGLWTDARKLRKDWPDAAVVGPLRTLRGIDLLVRSLLANPQIRVLVVTGRDLSPGQSVQKALEGLWTLTMPELNTMCREHGWPLNAMVGFLGNPNDGRGFIIVHDGDAEKMGEGTEEGGPESPQKYARRMAPSKDRPGGAIFLPPPPPPERPELPAGLTGQRVTGRTLAEVWPKVLQEVLRFGDAVPTSYGGSRELLNLVSVIEDPAGSLDDMQDAGAIQAIAEGHDRAIREHGHERVGAGGILFGATASTGDMTGAQKRAATAAKREEDKRPHPVLGVSWADLHDYYTKSFMGKVPPRGTEYTYGSRLQGGDSWRMWWKLLPPWMESDTTTVMCLSCGNFSKSQYGNPSVSTMPDSCCPSCGYSTVAMDQTAAVRQLLTEQPGSRAAYLTPWRPDEDAGKESGRPCMVGAWFRATGGPGRCYVCGQEATCEAREGAPAPWQPMCDTHCARDPEDGERREVVRTLHLSVQFRSHDLHGAYPLNLAACCLWLCEEAKAQGMEVGMVTCLSMSAHVYDHAAEAASEVVAKHVKAGAWSQDARSAWRVWKADVHAEQPDPENPWAVIREWHRCNQQPWLSKGAEACRRGGFRYTDLIASLTNKQDADLKAYVKAECEKGPPIPMPIIGHTFHAEATDPAGTRVLRAFEAPTKERLIKDIQASGLVTSVQHALWLGAEVGKL